jgi:hypothetical protein
VQRTVRAISPDPDEPSVWTPGYPRSSPQSSQRSPRRSLGPAPIPSGEPAARRPVRINERTTTRSRGMPPQLRTGAPPSARTGHHRDTGPRLTKSRPIQLWTPRKIERSLERDQRSHEFRLHRLARADLSPLVLSISAWDTFDRSAARRQPGQRSGGSPSFGRRGLLPTAGGASPCPVTRPPSGRALPCGSPAVLVVSRCEHLSWTRSIEPAEHVKVDSL